MAAQTRTTLTLSPPAPTPVPRDRRVALWCLVIGFVLLSLYGKIVADTGRVNLYAQQAGAFLHGHWNIPSYMLDTAVFRGRYYVPFPPFPALVLLPFVAVFGVAGTKATLVGIALTGLSAAVLWSLLGKMEVRPQLRPWLLAGFFGGTAYWFCLRECGGVWHFAHIVAVTCLLLSCREALGKGRGLWAGLWLGLAFLSRQMMLGAVVFLVVALLQNPALGERRARLKSLAGFACAMIVCLAAYLLSNAARFGSPLDTGYGHLALQSFLQVRFEQYGMFNPAYFPFNFAHLFLQGFHIEFGGPALLDVQGLSPFGTSLTFASPFLLAAFWARWQPPLLRSAWVSILLICLPSLFYYNNGWYQINAQRFSLDFLPILILVVARSLDRIDEKLWKGAVLFSVGLNALAFCFPVS